MTKIVIFSKVWLKSRFFDIWSKIGIFRNFRKFWTKSNFFSKIWPNRIFFENFYKNWNFSKFSKKSNWFEFWPNSKVLETLTEIRICGNFDRSRNFFYQNRNFPNSTEIEIYRNFRKHRFFSKFDQNRNFFENVTEIEILRKIWLKSKFIENFDQNRNFWLK